MVIKIPTPQEISNAYNQGKLTPQGIQQTFNPQQTAPAPVPVATVAPPPPPAPAPKPAPTKTSTAKPVAKTFYKYDNSPAIFRIADNYEFHDMSEFQKAGGLTNLSNVEVRKAQPAINSGAVSPINQAQIAGQQALNNLSPDQLNDASVARDTFQATMLEGGQLVDMNTGLIPSTGDFDYRKDMQNTLNDIRTMITDLNDPNKQRASLVSEYDRIRREAGLPELEEKVLNMDKIMRGTVDDIRTELQKSGALTTESMVEYLAATRNKVLLNELVTLENMRAMKEQYVNKMMELTGLDRAEADKRFEKVFNLQGRILDIEDKLQLAKERADDKAYTKQQNATQFALDYNITKPYYQIGDTIYRSSDQFGFSKDTEFFKDSGVKSFKEAEKLGIVQKVDRGQSLKERQFQQDKSDSEFDRYVKQQNLNLDRERLNLQKTELGLKYPGTENTAPAKPGTYDFSNPDEVANLPVSDLTKSIIAGTGKLKELTPSDKASVMKELYKVGYNPHTTLLNKINGLADKYDALPAGSKGAVRLPFTGKFSARAAEFDSARTLLTREIARLNEVGVLSDQDVAAYNSAMPNRADGNAAVVRGKIKGLMDAVGMKTQDNLDNIIDTNLNGSVSVEKTMASIRQFESGGNYKALGQVQKNGDRAYGAYQVMASNIPSWTKQATGKSYTPAQFLASKEIQDAVARHKMSEYASKYGSVENIAIAWFAGPGAVGKNNKDKKDSVGTSVPKYVASVRKIYNSIG